MFEYYYSTNSYDFLYIVHTIVHNNYESEYLLKNYRWAASIKVNLSKHAKHHSQNHLTQILANVQSKKCIGIFLHLKGKLQKQST